MNKFRNKIVTIDNIKFRSIKEGNRYIELKHLLKLKLIKDLILQPKFILSEKYMYRNMKIKKETYSADFQYVYDGKLIIEDVKGVRTNLYKLKISIFLKTIIDNDNIIFKEI